MGVTGVRAFAAGTAVIERDDVSVTQRFAQLCWRAVVVVNDPKYGHRRRVSSRSPGWHAVAMDYN